jgi:Zn-dependent peptidase ImmA (M78 family)
MARHLKSIKGSIAELTALAEKYSYQVKIANSNEVDPKKKLISISHNCSDIQRLAVLAHELGHILLHRRGFLEKVKGYVEKENCFWEKEEEFQAWVIADRLIREINPRLYSINYIKYKNLCLATYYRICRELPRTSGARKRRRRHR